MSKCRYNFIRKKTISDLIDDLIKQIEDIPTIKESDTGKMILMGEGMKREVIKILQEAKK